MKHIRVDTQTVFTVVDTATGQELVTTDDHTLAAAVAAQNEVDVANFRDALIQRAAEFLVAEDKAFTGKAAEAEVEARAAREALTWALATFDGTDVAAANEAIMLWEPPTA